MNNIIQAVIAGVIVAFITIAAEALFRRFGPWKSEPSQAIGAGSSVDNRRISILQVNNTTNVSQSVQSTGSEKAVGQGANMWVIAVITVVATITFLFAYEGVVLVVVAASTALLIIGVRVGIGSYRLVKVTNTTMKAMVEVSAAGVIGLVVAGQVLTVERGPLSLSSLRVAQRAFDPSAEFWTQVGAAISNQVVWLSSGIGPNAWVLALSFTVSIIIASALILYAAVTVLRWRSYVRYESGMTSSARSADSVRQLERVSWGAIVTGILVAIIAIVLFASGLGYDLVLQPTPAAL